MGFYVAGVSPTDLRGEELMGIHREEAWLSILELLRAIGNELLPPDAWARLATNSAERVPAEAALVLAERLGAKLSAFERDHGEASPGTRYVSERLIPFLRHCGGFEVT